MKSEKTISAQIGAVKSAIVALGDMRPGHLSFQRRANGKNPRCYAQQSYTFKKQSRTDYVQPDDVDRVKAEIENYRKFKSLCERLVERAIEASKLKSEKRKRQTASSTGQKLRKWRTCRRNRQEVKCGELLRCAQ